MCRPGALLGLTDEAQSVDTEVAFALGSWLVSSWWSARGGPGRRATSVILGDPARLTVTGHP